MNLNTLFDFSVRRYPDHVAIIQDKKKMTYSEMNQEVNRVAHSLQRLGVRKQDRIAVLLKNKIETIVLFWAIQKLGAIFIPVNFKLSSEDIRYCINDVESKVIFYDDLSSHLIHNEKFKERPILIGLNVPNADLTFDELVSKGSSFDQSSSIDDNDLAVILYTSGTSGKPKGVPRSHKNEYTSTIAHILQCAYQPLDVTLGAMQLYHTMGMRSLLAMMILNGKYIAIEDFDAYEALESIEKHHVSTLYLNPTMYHDMVYHPQANKTDFSAIRSISYAGAPMSKELIKKCDQVFQPQHFVNHYGSTEIYTITTCPNIREKPGCVGKAGIHQQIQIVVPDPRREWKEIQTVKTGEVGEIIVNIQSFEAFKGYWNRPDATRLAIRDRWYFTSDLGYYDKDGDLYVVGRVDDMILSGVDCINPYEIENVIKEHEKVEEVLVTGEEDPRWGRIPVAYVVPKETVTAQELDQFCKKDNRLANYKRPRKYIFISEIPKNDNGKIMRKKFKENLNKLISY